MSAFMQESNWRVREAAAHRRRYLVFCRCLHLKEPRQHFSRLAFDDVRESGCIERLFGTHINGSGAALMPPVNKAGGGVNGAAGANYDHERGFSNFVLEAVHLQRSFAEENDVRAQPSAAGTAGHFIQTAIDGAIL